MHTEHVERPASTVSLGQGSSILIAISEALIEVNGLAKYRVDIAQVPYLAGFKPAAKSAR